MLKRARRWTRKRKGRLAAAAAVLAVIAAVVLGVVYMPVDGPTEATAARYAGLEEHREVRAEVRGEAPPPSVHELALPPAPTPVLYDASVTRLRIPSIGVDADVIPMNLLPDGTMDSPPGPDPVAWYDFTGKPGLGGNAVFSGHVDYVGRGPAVFWDLRKLVEGDLIEVLLADGTRIEYRVTASQLYDVTTIPMGEVVAPTPTESVTLITCGGTFEAGDYTHRLVLRAARSEVIPAGG